MEYGLNHFLHGYGFSGVYLPEHGDGERFWFGRGERIVDNIGNSSKARMGFPQISCHHYGKAKQYFIQTHFSRFPKRLALCHVVDF